MAKEPAWERKFKKQWSGTLADKRALLQFMRSIVSEAHQSGVEEGAKKRTEEILKEMYDFFDPKKANFNTETIMQHIEKKYLENPDALDQ